MARAQLPWFNASTYGEGIEGVTNYANQAVNNLFIPAFLIAIYGIALFVWSKSEYKMGAGVMFISLVMFIVAIILQTVTAFNQIIIFIFFVGIIVGVIISFVDRS